MKLEWGGAIRTHSLLYADAREWGQQWGQEQVPSLPSTNPNPALCRQKKGRAFLTLAINISLEICLKIYLFIFSENQDGFICFLI